MSEWDNQPGDVPFEVPGEEYHEIPDVVAPADADTVAQSQAGFSEIPPGTHELVILGYFGEPSEVYFKADIKDPKSGHTQRVGYTCTKRTLKIGLASNPKASILFDVYQPPRDPAQAIAYWHGVPEGKKAQGWHAHTFRGIVGAAIAPWPVGQPMPRAAKFEQNWVNRHFVGTIDPAEPYTDNSGQQKPGKPKLNQRSFKPAPGQTPLTSVGNPSSPTAAPATASQGQGQRPPQSARRPAPAAAPVAPTEWQM